MGSRIRRLVFHGEAWDMSAAGKLIFASFCTWTFVSSGNPSDTTGDSEPVGQGGAVCESRRRKRREGREV